MCGLHVLNNLVGAPQNSETGTHSLDLIIYDVISRHFEGKLQRPAFTKSDLDAIADKLSETSRELAIPSETFFSSGTISSFTRNLLQRILPGNSHRTYWTGNYDVTVLQVALQRVGVDICWTNGFRELDIWEGGNSKSNNRTEKGQNELDGSSNRQLIGLIIHKSRSNSGLPWEGDHWLALCRFTIRTSNGLENEWWNLDSKLELPTRIGGIKELKRWLAANLGEDGQGGQALLVFRMFEKRDEQRRISREV